MEEYENLKNQNIAVTMSDLTDWPLILIKARIIKGLTQAQLAQQVHLKQQQIQRYEANNYKGVSFNRILMISKALGVEFQDKIKIKM